MHDVDTIADNRTSWCEHVSRTYTERTPYKFVVYRAQGRRNLGINRVIQEPGQIARTTIELTARFSLH